MTDAIAGMLYVMTAGKNGEAYNICTESGEASVLEGKAVKVEFAQETQKKDLAVKHALSRVCADSQKLRGLGWTEKVSIEDACRRMMAYYGIEIV